MEYRRLSLVHVKTIQHGVISANTRARSSKRAYPEIAAGATSGMCTDTCRPLGMPQTVADGVTITNYSTSNACPKFCIYFVPTSLRLTVTGVVASRRARGGSNWIHFWMDTQDGDKAQATLPTRRDLRAHSKSAIGIAGQSYWRLYHPNALSRRKTPLGKTQRRPKAVIKLESING